MYQRSFAVHGYGRSVQWVEKKQQLVQIKIIYTEFREYLEVVYRKRTLLGCVVRGHFGVEKADVASFHGVEAKGTPPRAVLAWTGVETQTRENAALWRNWTVER